MAPRPIDDSAVLVEIAIETICNPTSSFAAIYRTASQRVSPHVHSDDSARKRIQEKFKRKKTYWLERGQEAIEERIAAERQRRMDQIEDTIEMVGESERRIAEQFGPVIEDANRMLERCRPAIEAAQAQLSSPIMRQALKNHDSMLRYISRL